MAKRTLSNSTSLTNPRAVIGGNAPPSDDSQFPAIVAAWNPTKCQQVGMSGLTGQVKAKSDMGSATQRMVASIMGYFAWWHAKGHPLDKPAKDGNEPFKVTIHPLSEMAPAKDTKDAQDMRKLIIAQFFTKLSQVEFNKLSAGDKSKYKTEETNIGQLVRRAMKLAAILFMDGITLNDWSDDSNCFRVHPSHLITPGYEGAGRLRNSDTKVLLDNAQMHCMKDPGSDGEKVDWFNASADRVALVYNLRRDPNFGKRGTVDKPKAFLATDALDMETCHRVIESAQSNRTGMLVAIAKYISEAGNDFAPAALGRVGYEAFTTIAQCWAKLEQRADWKAKRDIMMKAPAPAGNGTEQKDAA